MSKHRPRGGAAEQVNELLARAERFAEMLIDEYGLPEHPTWDDFARICVILGIGLCFQPRLREEGYAVTGRLKGILLRSDARLRIAFHELFHILLRGNSQGLHTFGANPDSPEEQGADWFSRITCPPPPPARVPKFPLHRVLPLSRASDGRYWSLAMDELGIAWLMGATAWEFAEIVEGPWPNPAWRKELLDFQAQQQDVYIISVVQQALYLWDRGSRQL